MQNIEVDTVRTADYLYSVRKSLPPALQYHRASCAVAVRSHLGTFSAHCRLLDTATSSHCLMITLSKYQPCSGGDVLSATSAHPRSLDHVPLSQSVSYPVALLERRRRTSSVHQQLCIPEPGIVGWSHRTTYPRKRDGTWLHLRA